ncbi:MAG: nuclear transport factor 2 family protein [Candidatus Eremiobacteraeota bacterium]|nr:nuclear transport factor 2 family protein [Candidatus Eremiobacteraeota bacterium]
MPDSKKSDTVRALFTAFLSQDRKAADALLSDGFTFTSPYDDAIDRAAYFERCWPNSKHLKTHVIEKILAEHDGAFVMYRASTTDGSEFRNTERFEFDGDQIKSVDVFFGATYKDGRFVKQVPG